MKEKLKLSPAVLLPYLIIVAMLIGFLLAFSLNRLDFAIRGLGIAIPALLSALLLLKIYRRDLNLDNPIHTFSCNKKTLMLLFGILYAISVCTLLLTSYRPWYYFVVISALYILIFIQIFSKNMTPATILLEITFIMMNLIYGVTLKYPLYFGWTDTLGHIFLSEVTYLSGHVIPEDLSISYAYFPLYHIFISESSYILGLDIKTSLFIVTCIPYVITVIFIYYIFNQIIQNKQISLLACILYSMSSVVVYYGTYMVTRTLAFVGFIILLYLLYKGAEGKNNKVVYKVLAILMAVFLILVHQVSMPQIVILLSILLVCEWIINDKKYLKTNFFMLLNVMFLGYWIYMAWLFMKHVIKTHIRPIYFEQPVIKSSIQPGNELSFLVTNIDSFMLVFFALIGIGYILWKGKPKYASVFGLFALVTLILYIPNPLQTLWQTMNLFRFDRFMLFISPFMALVMGWGIYIFYNYLLKKNVSKKICSVIIILMVAGFCFTSVVQQNAKDCEDFPWEQHRRYFSNEELQGFNYIFEHVPYGSTLYSDYYTERFFSQREFSKSKNLGLPFYSSRRIPSVNDISECKGYITIRDKEFSNAGLRFGHVASIELYAPTDENKQQLYNNLQKRDTIYSSYAVDIYQSEIAQH